uniref:Uncharacterized protein n=1 Tax=Steinernema glaseri TaxID=37863 RepID=A0A1I7ZD84_9BILA
MSSCFQIRLESHPSCLLPPPQSIFGRRPKICTFTVALPYRKRSSFAALDESVADIAASDSGQPVAMAPEVSAIDCSDTWRERDAALQKKCTVKEGAVIAELLL